MTASDPISRQENAGASSPKNRPGLKSRGLRCCGLRARPRWNKVLSDLWGNPVRTILVVASIAVGLFAVGMLGTVRVIMTEDLTRGYAAVNPVNINIQAGTFDEEIVDLAQRVAGVKEAEGLRTFNLMVRTGSDEWSRIGVSARLHFSEKRISQVELESGTWPPGDHEIVIERNKLNEVVQIQSPEGPLVEVKLPSGKVRQLRLVGAVHDQTVGLGDAGGFFLAPIQGYISADTLEWLEQQDDYNRLYVTVQGDSEDEEYMREVANRISRAMEDENVLVYNAAVYRTTDHPNAAYINGISGVLIVLGALIVFLSGFLITNTFQSLLNQQTQQIAIMKTIGARSSQVSLIYVTLIFTFSILALVISLPLSRSAAFWLVTFLSARMNTSVLSLHTVPSAVISQVVIALVVPQIAGIIPILRGTRIRIQEVLTGSLVEVDPMQRGWIDRKLADVKGLSRPLLISLRNTFRHKGRLALTLVTLTLGGAIFIATFNSRASLEEYINRVSHYFLADVNLTLENSQRISVIQEDLGQVEGVGGVEGWAYGRSELLLEDDRGGDSVQLLGPPVNSKLIEPILLKGRWVREGDEGAIVLSERFFSRYPDLDVGDTLRMRVNGKKTEWVVVGFFQLVGKSAGFVAYTNYEYLASLVRQENRALTFRVTASRTNLSIDEQEELGSRLEKALQDQGIGVAEVRAGGYLIQDTSRPLDTLTLFLLIMAGLTALVGSFGLAGTMSMNVLDRTREIGVMRAIGASDRMVMSLVLVEGVLIGLLSWLAGVMVAVPITQVLSDVIHLAIFDARAEFTFTAFGPLAWLGCVIVLSVLASVIPARSAAHLTIREALAYE